MNEYRYRHLGPFSIQTNQWIGGTCVVVVDDFGNYVPVDSRITAYTLQDGFAA